MTDVTTIANGTPRTIGLVQNYDDLHQLLRQRAEELNLSREEIGRLGHLTGGHAAKLLAPVPIKRATFQTLEFLLPALGAALVLVEDPVSMEQIARKATRREVQVGVRAYRWGQAGNRLVSKRWIRRIAREGGRARAAKLTPAQRSRSARKAALARWSKPGVNVKGNGRTART